MEAIVLDAVLFDLDGTLLDIDIESFLGTYFAALEQTLANIFEEDQALADAMQAIYDATGAMMRPHEPLTNSDVFYAEFERLTGVSLIDHADLIDAFYRDVFPGLGVGLGPAPGAHAAIAAARACDLKVAVATNPIFPRAAILHRMKWAQIAPDGVDAITDFETMLATKPLPAYFRQTAKLLGVDPSRCLMVGDDRMLDLAAADVGMRTYHVSQSADAAADYSGSMEEVAALITRLCNGTLPTLD